VSKIDPSSLYQPHKIHAIMLKEAPVFDRRNRFHHHLRNVVILHQLALGALLGVK
jgi:hypothetical protein